VGGGGGGGGANEEPVFRNFFEKITQNLIFASQRLETSRRLGSGFPQTINLVGVYFG